MTLRRKILHELRRNLELRGKRPHTTSLQPAVEDIVDSEFRQIDHVKPYSAVPGPRELPFVGNAWRFLPFIGELFVIF